MDNELNRLLTEKNYDELAEKLNGAEQNELAEFFSALSDEELKEAVRGFESEDTAQFLLAIEDGEIKERIIYALRDRELKEVMDELSPSDTVEIIEDVPAEVALRFAEEDEILALLAERNFKVLKPLLSQFNSTDLAEILNEVPKNDIGVLFRLLPKELAADTFVELDSDMKKAVVDGLTDRELKAVTDELYLDDTVDLIEEMPANVVSRIIAQSDTETRGYINELLKYPKDSAGSIMTIEYVSLHPGMTVEAAFARIRKTGVDKETIYTLYVTDEKRKLIGIVSAKDLMLSPPTALIGDIMEENVIYVDTLTDKEDAARTIAKYGFLAIPVVDTEQRLVGIVTVDDAMDVIQEENTEDIAKMAAMSPSDMPYLKTSVWSIWKNRIPWLLVLMVSATFTGLIINTYEARLTAISTVLFACVPMMMDTGGNAGSQASVTVIRALALDELRTSDVLKVIWKEFRSSLLLGVTLGIACFCKLMLIDNLLFGFSGYTPVCCAVVSAALVVTVIIAKLVGCTLPILAKKCRLDPAVVASPFITTIVDAISLIIYCNLAVAVLSAI